MAYKFLIVLIVLLSLSMLKSVEVEDTYLAVMNAYEKIENFQADLIQTNTFKAEKMEIESKAKFYYQSDRIKISYSEPQEQTILMNGLAVKFYDKTSNTCVEMWDKDNTISLNPLFIIDKYWKYSDKKMTDEDTILKLSLRPLQENEFKTILVEISKENYFITMISYEDPDGNIVNLKFNNINTDTEIPEDTWRLNLPEDVNYIKR
ncbi:MAG: outer membrane lipoprotein carrier protein LolA [Candidatus Zophobacter franzmannii]|nr:outer membrane lipoprotein carrier protein LolA [Candidatus Zophobacter franzmannii]